MPRLRRRSAVGSSTRRPDLGDRARPDRQPGARDEGAPVGHSILGSFRRPASRMDGSVEQSVLRCERNCHHAHGILLPRSFAIQRRCAPATRVRAALARWIARTNASAAVDPVGWHVRASSCARAGQGGRTNQGFPQISAELFPPAALIVALAFVGGEQPLVRSGGASCVTRGRSRSVGVMPTDDRTVL